MEEWAEFRPSLHFDLCFASLATEEEVGLGGVHFELRREEVEGAWEGHVTLWPGHVTVPARRGSLLESHQNGGYRKPMKVQLR